MGHARTAAGTDRLPWLEDEPMPSRDRRRRRELAGWVAAAALLAIASLWTVGHGRREQGAVEQQPRQTTVALPPAHPAEPPQPEVLLKPAPEVRPTPERQVPLPTPRVERPVARLRAAEGPQRGTPEAERKSSAAPAVQTVAPATSTSGSGATANKPLTLWPAWQSQGAAGRIVRIGAFGSRFQAKLGWRYMVHAYPAVAHLPATVVETRNSRRRLFYRFQIGTTSQAHSEVLCQRMERIHLSCAVIGLAWKPKGVER